MHFLLTDSLACPRCGPEFGLILLADVMDDRRVSEGRLGCSNCRDQYPIRGGFGDLRPQPRGELPAQPTEPRRPSEDDVVRLGAALGVVGGPGHIALVGEVARLAPMLSEAIPEVEIVAVHGLTAGLADVPGVSRMVSGARLPFHSRTLRAVAVDGAAPVGLLEEAIRVTGPRGRVVVIDPPETVYSRFQAAGLELILQDSRLAVAARSS